MCSIMKVVGAISANENERNRKKIEN